MLFCFEIQFNSTEKYIRNVILVISYCLNSQLVLDKVLHKLKEELLDLPVNYLYFILFFQRHAFQ